MSLSFNRNHSYISLYTGWIWGLFHWVRTRARIWRQRHHCWCYRTHESVWFVEDTEKHAYTYLSPYSPCPNAAGTFLSGRISTSHHIKSRSLHRWAHARGCGAFLTLESFLCLYIFLILSMLDSFSPKYAFLNPLYPYISELLQVHYISTLHFTTMYTHIFM